MKQIFFEEEIANLISMTGDMITCTADDYSKYYKAICDDKNLSNELASHIIAVVQSCRSSIVQHRDSVLFRACKSY